MAGLVLLLASVAGAQEQGLAGPGVDYPVPPAAPRGNVRVTSFGVTDLRPNGGGASARALQVRLLLTNQTDVVPWTLDTRQVIATLSGEGQSRPALVNTDAGSPPVLRIAPGRSVIVDLFYPLPPALASAGAPPFAVSWQVSTGAGVVAERTPFDLAGADEGYAEAPDDESGPDVLPPDASAYDYAPAPSYAWATPSFGFTVGLGPYWWYDPLYTQFAFVHRPLIAFGPGWYRPHLGWPWGFGHRVYWARPFGGYRYGYGYRGYGYRGYGYRDYGYRGYGGRPSGYGYRGYAGRPSRGFVTRGGFGGRATVSPGFRGGFGGRATVSPGFRGGFGGHASPGFRSGGGFGGHASPGFRSGGHGRR